MIRVGIVGHRFLGGQYTVDFVTEQCVTILQKMKESRNNVVALSAIAEGADTIFAEAAFSLHIPLEIITPFEKYLQDFGTSALKQRYQRLRMRAAKEIRLPYYHRSDEAYSTAMQWVVRTSDLLIVVWDGKKGNGKAGTSEAVKLAADSNKDWIHLDVAYQSTKFYVKNFKLPS